MTTDEWTPPNKNSKTRMTNKREVRVRKENWKSHNSASLIGQVSVCNVFAAYFFQFKISSNFQLMIWDCFIYYLTRSNHKSLLDWLRTIVFSFIVPSVKIINNKTIRNEAVKFTHKHTIIISSSIIIVHCQCVFHLFLFKFVQRIEEEKKRNSLLAIPFCFFLLLLFDNLSCVCVYFSLLLSLSFFLVNSTLFRFTIRLFCFDYYYLSILYFHFCLVKIWISMDF